MVVVSGNTMKRLFRIIFGTVIVPAPFLISSWIWLWTSKEPYSEVLWLSWNLMSGQWEKLPN